jgi:hypothetical protein
LAIGPWPFVVPQLALEPLAAQHPTIPVVLRYMEHKPVRDGTAALLAHAQPSGLVYAELDPRSAATGRSSCSNPNLQGLAAPVLPAIEAAPGCVLLPAGVDAASSPRKIT